MTIPLPGQQQKDLDNKWYLPPETSIFLQRVCFSDTEFQTELQQFEIICAEQNAHDISGTKLPGQQKEEMFSERHCWILTLPSRTLELSLAKTPNRRLFYSGRHHRTRVPSGTVRLVTVCLSIFRSQTYHHHCQPDS